MREAAERVDLKRSSGSNEKAATDEARVLGVDDESTRT
jgi:hypothetical protein